MPVIKDLIEAAAVKIAGFRRCRLGSHRKTPAFGGPAPRSRHFTMLREDQESRSLNDLWVVQGRLSRRAAGEVEMASVERLTLEEIHLLKPWVRKLELLERGDFPANTEARRHFLQVCWGEA